MERRRVLIVDDHVHAREGLRGTLELDPGLEVIREAGNGTEALSLVEELRPDVVLMDIQMPVLDGFETTRRIKRRWPEIRAVALTMYQDRQEQVTAAGVDAFLVMGTPLSELLEAPLRDNDSS